MLHYSLKTIFYIFSLSLLLLGQGLKLDLDLIHTFENTCDHTASIVRPQSHHHDCDKNQHRSMGHTDHQCHCHHSHSPFICEKHSLVQLPPFKFFHLVLPRISSFYISPNLATDSPPPKTILN